MGFWIRKAIMGTILVATAYILLVNQELLVSIIKSFSEEPPTTQEQVLETTEQESASNTEQTTATTETKAPKKKIEKSTNAAAEGLSRFYASINPSFTEGNGPRIRENIVYLDKPKGELSKILEARKMVTQPLRKTWKGDIESRPFRTGQTLYQKLSEYGQNEGVEVIWWLDRDFLVKDPFRIDKNILKTSYQIGKAIEGHFENGVDIFFCHKHRAIILTDKKDAYLNNQCKLLGNQDSTW